MNKIGVIWSNSTRYGFYLPISEDFYDRIAELNPWWVRNCTIQEYTPSEWEEEAQQLKMNGIAMYKLS